MSNETPDKCLQAAKQNSLNGRAEALRVILALDPERGLDDYITSRVSYDGEPDCQWDQKKLEELFGLRGNYDDSPIERLAVVLDDMYWQLVAKKDNYETLLDLVGRLIRQIDAGGMKDGTNSPLKLLRTGADYEEAIEHINSLIDADPSQERTQEMELWAKLIELYEEREYPIDRPDSIGDEEGVASKSSNDCEIIKVCHWTVDDCEASTWRGTCNVVWYFPDGASPKDSDLRYCPHCGGIALIDGCPVAGADALADEEE